MSKNTMTPFGSLPHNPDLAAAIRNADKEGLTEARAQAIMQSAGELSHQEETVIDALAQDQALKGASKIGLTTLVALKEKGAATRESIIGGRQRTLAAGSFFFLGIGAALGWGVVISAAAVLVAGMFAIDRYGVKN